MPNSSPLSPTEKRMRIMDDSDDSHDGVTDDARVSEDSLSSGYGGPRYRIRMVDDDLEVYGDDEDDDDDDDDDDIEEDDDDEDDDDDDDDDDDYDFIDYDSDEDDDIDLCTTDEYLKHDPTPENQYPKPEWITVNELHQRRCGMSSVKRPCQSNKYWFERYASNSLWMIQRLELGKRLEEHTACVNCLDFNSTGNLICSGSVDTAICIWDWQKNKLIKKINTGHVNNRSQFCESDKSIVIASRDGTVRLINVETGLSELLSSQSGEIGKIAFITPQTFVTCGTNAYVNFIDLRTREPTKLFIVRNSKNNRSCALYTINAHPLDNHKVVVAGASPYVYLYDLRRVARNPNDYEHKPVYCMDKFENTNNFVTSTAFNSTGENLLISYNDDDLYVCKLDTGEIVHRYKGHRNKKTITGCTWFGDNYVMSGSDDGHIYGWDYESEHIVCFLDADVNGIVSHLSVHSSLPVLASAGLDHNVKIWEPTSKTWPQTLYGIKPQICKNTMRRELGRKRRTLALQSSEADDDDSDSHE